MALPAAGLLGPLAVLQVGYFLWTKIQEIGKTVDWWWISLSSPGGPTGCGGQNSLSPTSNHSPISCPVTCSGYRWMCLRRFIIYLLFLLLVLTFLLVLLDWWGLLPVCPFMPVAGERTINCRTCTTSAAEAPWRPLCCCILNTGGNCTCTPIPSSWALGKYLWGLASHHFSWLSLLQQFALWFAGLSSTAWLLLIWMMWYWGPGLFPILSPFIPAVLIFWYLWA
uniref:Surface protein n=1 Tax=Tent-making bat hepatitis B virus TaxID=1508712 RepID=A0A7I6NBD5_9HEPA|nr:surface protein [Tent-making bat hepatitis B virus]